MTTPRPRRLLLAFLGILLVAAACGAEAAVETAGAESGDAAAEESSAAEPAAGDESGSDAIDPREFFVEDYDDPRLQGHDLAALVPSPADLGPGWEQFYVGISEELTFLEPAEETTGGLDLCDITTPLVIRHGFIGEFGFGESPDDAALVVSQGSAEQLREFYETFLAVTTCNERQGLEVDTKPAPDINGAIETVRFSTSEDDIGQYSEAILILRDDVVFYLDVYQLEGAEPVDFDELVIGLFAAHDESGP